MEFIRLTKASKDIGIKNIFKDLDLNISKKERLGLIGPNGSGKSTLLKILGGTESIEDGEIYFSPNLKVALITQETKLNPEKTIIQEVLEGCGEKKDLLINFAQISKQVADNPLDQNLIKKLGFLSDQMDIAEVWNLEQQCQEVLRKLGIKDYEKKIKDLSGGYKKRVGLASALVSKPDILLLDEPTNHLDANSVEWLESWLKTYKGALVLITHDRYFLDAITNQIIEIDSGEVYKYQGNYSQFLSKKIEFQNSMISKEKKLSSLLKKELEWLKKSPKARSAKQKARVNRINKMREKEKKITNLSLDLKNEVRRIGKIAIEAENIKLHVGLNKSSEVIIDNFSYNFEPKDRVGIIGKNGTGKSCLLDLIAGRRKNFQGNLRIGETVHIGYLDQHTNDLESGKGLKRKVIEYLEEFGTTTDHGGKKISASKLLEKFLFPPSQQHVSLSKLSGGEKRRLNLCKILMQTPNVLLLDEPTNDLDIQTLNILEELIREFNGCVIIVSHDRYFLDKTVKRIFCLEKKILNRYEGNYSDYIRKKRDEIEKESSSNLLKGSNFKKKNTNNQFHQKKVSKALTYKECKEVESIEIDLPKLEANKIILEKELSLGSKDLEKLSRELAKILDDIALLEERWIELNERIN